MACGSTSVDGHAVTFAGPGAGPEVTAVTILDDIAEMFTGDRSSSPAAVDRSGSRVLRFDEPPAGGWFVKVAGATHLLPGHVAEFFAGRGAPLLHLVSEHGDLYGVTAPAPSANGSETIAAFRAIGASTIAIPVLAGAPRE